MKAVIFDFDGTLTKKDGNLWKKIWQSLGYNVGPESYYMSLLKKFINKELSHPDWCVLTLEAYKSKGLSKSFLNSLIDKIKLIYGVEDLFQRLYDKGVEICIVSGNIISVIQKVLGDAIHYVSEIKANEFVFDEQGNIIDIVGTKYDHEGKAKFVLELCDKKGYKPSEVLFVGNSLNDEWVYKSGAKTLCINPDNTKSDNREIWNKVIFTDNLLDLEKEIL